MPIFRVSNPALKHAQNEPPLACFVNFLANRGGDPSMRSKVCIFSTVFAHVASETYIFSVFPSFLLNSGLATEAANVYILRFPFIFTEKS